MLSTGRPVIGKRSAEFNCHVEAAHLCRYLPALKKCLGRNLSLSFQIQSPLSLFTAAVITAN
jgi:hypothetical protein